MREGYSITQEEKELIDAHIKMHRSMSIAGRMISNVPVDYKYLDVHDNVAMSEVDYKQA